MEKSALGIMIGSSLFIFLCGILFCCMGKTTEGIVCICAGVFAGSVFFLLPIAGKQEPSNKVPKVSGVASPNPNCLKTGSGSNSRYITIRSEMPILFNDPKKSTLPQPGQSRSLFIGLLQGFRLLCRCRLHLR